MEQLVPFILKSFLLAGVALLLLRLLRDRSAAARSVVAHLALLALVLMPVANLFLPPLQIAVAQWADPPASHIPLNASPATGSSTAPTFEAIGTLAGGQVPSADDDFVISADDWAVLAYALPAIGLLLIALVGIGRLFVLRARSSLLEDTTWLSALTRAQRRMGVGQRTTLLVSDDLPSPISWGLVWPVIILDRETLHLHDQAEAILAHELAHIARFDWARLLFARVATALYWFNPLVWILAREAHQLREEAADDAVLTANIADTDYAQLLVRTARHQFHGPLLTAHGVAPSRHSLGRRIRRVLDAGSARGPAPRRFAFGVSVGTLVLTAPLAALSFDASGAPMENGRKSALATMVVRTVAKVTEGTTDVVRSAIESPLHAALPTKAANAEAPTTTVVAESAATVAPPAGSITPSADAPAAIQEAPNVLAALQAPAALATVISVAAVVEPVARETTIPLYGRDSFRKVVPISDSAVFLQARSGQWFHATLGKGCRGFARALAPRTTPGSPLLDPLAYTISGQNGIYPNYQNAPFPGSGTLSVGSNRPDGNFGRLSVVRVEDQVGRLDCQIESLVESGPPPSQAASPLGSASRETTISLHGRDSFRKVVPISDSVVYLQARSGQWYNAALGKGCRGFVMALAPRSPAFDHNMSSQNGLHLNPPYAPLQGGGTLSVGSNRPDGNFGRLSVMRVEDQLAPLSCQVESLVESGPPSSKDP